MPITIYPGTVKKRNSDGTYSDLVPGAGAGSQGADIIADEYDSASGIYSIGDYCVYQAVLYKCITAISVPEAFDSSKWEEVTVSDEISDVNNALNQLDQNMAYVESGNTATRTYTGGEFISWKGTLYTASTGIPMGDPFAVGTNLAAVGDGGGFNLLNAGITDAMMHINEDVGIIPGNQTIASVQNSVVRSGINALYMVDSLISGWTICLTLVQDWGFKGLVFFNSNKIVVSITEHGDSSWLTGKITLS